MSGLRNRFGPGPLVVAAALLLTLASGRPLLAAPANDNWSSATTFNIPATSWDPLAFAATNTSATAEPGETAHCGETATHSVWWKFTAQVTESIEVNTSGSGFDTVLAVYTGSSLTNLSIVTTNDDRYGQTWGQVYFRAIAGETYFIAVDGVEGDSGSVVLNVRRRGQNEMPSWQLADVHGNILRSSDYANKVVMIDFWETVCLGCVEEIPQLTILQDRYRAQGFQILGLYLNSGDTNNVIQFANELGGINYPLAELTPDVEVALAWLQETYEPSTSIQVFPTKYLIDRENKRVVWVGDGAKSAEYYESLIVPLLRVGTAPRLETRIDSGFLELTWPGAEVGYTLEASDTVSTNGWSTLLPINGERKLLVPYSTGSRFFRLRKTDQ